MPTEEQFDAGTDLVDEDGYGWGDWAQEPWWWEDVIEGVAEGTVDAAQESADKAMKWTVVMVLGVPVVIGLTWYALKKAP